MCGILIGQAVTECGCGKLSLFFAAAVILATGPSTHSLVSPFYRIRLPLLPRSEASGLTVNLPRKAVKSYPRMAQCGPSGHKRGQMTLDYIHSTMAVTCSHPGKIIVNTVP